MKQIKKMGGLKGLGAMFGKGGLGAAMPGWAAASRPGMGGLPGLGGGTPDLSKLLKK
jgi:signal recognition particle subunit SRP54